MKRTLMFTVLATMVIVAGSCAPYGQQSASSPTPSPVSQATATPISTENVDVTIRELVRERDAAIRTANTTALERLYADTYVSTGPTGLVRKKAEVMSDLTSGALKVESIESTEIALHPNGDTVVVTGLNRVKGTDRGKSLGDQNRFTQVWVKRNGRWQIVAFHLSGTPR